MEASRLAYGVAVAAALAILGVSASALGVGPDVFGFRSEGPAGVGESVTAGGVEVTLETARSTSAETSLVFVVRSRGAIDGPLRSVGIGPGRVIRVRGLTGESPPFLVGPDIGNAHRADGSVVLTVTIGGALLGVSEVQVTLPGLYLTGDGGVSVDVPDEFTFEFPTDPSVR